VPTIASSLLLCRCRSYKLLHNSCNSFPFAHAQASKSVHSNLERLGIEIYGPSSLNFILKAALLPHLFQYLHMLHRDAAAALKITIN
jgi:hypothetical protein